MSYFTTPTAEPPPLQVEKDGTIRVGGTRVTIDVVIGAFKNSNTAEQILNKYPSLSLANIYAAIAYYLRHQEEMDEYLDRRQFQAEQLRSQIETLCPPDNLWDRLAGRKQTAL